MSTIIAPMSGCVDLNDLLEAGTPLVWYVVGPHRFEAGAWRGDLTNCEPTTHHQRPLVIEGGTAALRGLDEGELLAILWDYQKQDKCGRHQIDVHDTETGEMAALVIKGLRDCTQEEIPVPPVIVIPPVVPPTAVPEPTSMLLVGGALILGALRRKMRR